MSEEAMEGMFDRYYEYEGKCVRCREGKWEMGEGKWERRGGFGGDGGGGGWGKGVENKAMK